MNVLKMRSGKISLIARIVYALVGASALYFGWQLFVENMFGRFSVFWEQAAIVFLVIGGFNWLIVAAFGDKMSDLFGLLNL